MVDADRALMLVIVCVHPGVLRGLTRTKGAIDPCPILFNVAAFIPTNSLQINFSSEKLELVDILRILECYVDC